MTATACGAPSHPAISLDRSDPAHPAVVVTGLSRRDVRTIERAQYGQAEWTSILRVSVAGLGPDLPAVAGRYEIRDGQLRFTPMFPLDAGRSYDVVFDPGQRLTPPVRASERLTLPSLPDNTPLTRISGVYPSGPDVPANLLRMYLEFSGPMGARGGEAYVLLMDDRAGQMENALLPLDTNLWNPDHTRFTLLFDPGRVKQGILPNRREGRPLREGQSFELQVQQAWPDGRARPLAESFSRRYTVGPAIERPLDPAAWRIAAPAAGSRDPLVVDFPWALDRGLAQRTLGVAAGDAAIDGTARVEDGERRWTFVPAQPWQPRAHALVVQPELEDPSGNRIGRAFEAIDPADDTHRAATRLPFVPR